MDGQSKKRMANSKPLKRELICYVLSKNGPVVGQVEILKCVHVLENSKIPFKETSNGYYFRNKVFTDEPQHWRDTCPEDELRKGSKWASSLVYQELIVPVWSENRRKILGYSLTDAGTKLAEETEKKFFSGVLLEQS